MSSYNNSNVDTTTTFFDDAEAERILAELLTANTAAANAVSVRFALTLRR